MKIAGMSCTKLDNYMRSLKTGKCLQRARETRNFSKAAVHSRNKFMIEKKSISCTPAVHVRQTYSRKSTRHEEAIIIRCDTSKVTLYLMIFIFLAYSIVKCRVSYCVIKKITGTKEKQKKNAERNEGKGRKVMIYDVNANASGCYFYIDDSCRYLYFLPTPHPSPCFVLGF